MRIQICCILFGLSINCSSQSFLKKNFLLDLGIDVGTYQTQGKEIESGKKVRDGTVGSVFHTGVEYAITNYIGIGAQLRTNNYSTDNDTASAKNTDFSLLANIHFLRTNYFNLYFGLKYGTSHFEYDNTKNQTTFAANGSHFQIDLGANLFVSKHFGFTLHTAYNNLHYSNGSINSPSAPPALYHLHFNGANIGLGMVGKF
ncbi:MAG TPA: outer membrane beta-barrel protein [Bacteroidia bacterium]|nr:outer membrane beta-barrel protein [Bacteroidia bacterium]